jgi:hypothetical protein
MAMRSGIDEPRRVGSIEWDIRDELAAMFMQAIITGRYAEGRDPAVEARATSLRAYSLAEEFLAVRRELDAEAGAAAEPEGDDSSAPAP